MLRLLKLQQHEVHLQQMLPHVQRKVQLQNVPLQGGLLMAPSEVLPEALTLAVSQMRQVLLLEVLTAVWRWPHGMLAKLSSQLNCSSP